MTFNFDSKTLPSEDFENLRNLIVEICGIEFNQDNKFILEKKVFSRIKELKLNSPGDYYLYLKFSPMRHIEIEKLINLLTTNETYFFREKNQLKAFQDEILPELYKKKSMGKKIRIWSAGCSTGEEPYTIAILIKEKNMFERWRVEIFASDINSEVLKEARDGIYGLNSFKETESRYANKYFYLQNGKFAIKEEIKPMVEFGKLNLLDTAKIKLLRPFDVIFCRNVLIYFTRETKRKVIDSFYEVMEEGGYLLLGHAESLLNVTTAFELVHLKNDIVYRKPAKK